MKAGKIRDMSLEEMKQKKAEIKESYFNLRFQNASDQLENTSKIRETRRDIARLMTIINETEIRSSKEDK